MRASISTPAPSTTTPGSPPGLTTYLIRGRDLAPGWVLLYLVTLVVQLFCAGFRAAIAYPILWVAFKLIGQSTAPIHYICLLVGYGPIALSLATLILPLGGWWWEQQSGGRSPSEREQLVYTDAIATLRTAEPRLRPPRHWFVLDEHELNAAVYGDTLMLTRGLLESGYLEAVLAHELGHLNSSAARLTAALHRLTTPPRNRVRRGLRTITLVATGGLGVLLTRAPWGGYWRAREHHADEYAAKLGQAQALGQFMQTHALDYDLPVPFIWLTDISHPPSEHRIDRLEHHPI